MKCDCDLTGHVESIEDLAPRERDDATLVELYERYGFRTWLRDLTGDAERVPAGDARVAAAPPVAPAEQDYRIIADWDAFDAWMAKVAEAPLVALDTETTSLDEMQARLVGLSMAVAPGVACYIPVAHRGPDGAEQLPKDEVLARLKPWLEDASRSKLLHHAKYDAHVLENEGIKLAGIAEDTMLQAYVLESHRGVGLNDLAQRYLGRSGVSYEDLCGKGAKQIGFDEVAVDKAGHYAAEDADFTLQLHHALRPQVEADAGLNRIYLLEMQVSAVLTIIERNGVKVDAAELGRQSHKLGQEMLQLEQKAYELAGQPFNLNSQAVGRDPVRPHATAGGAQDRRRRAVHRRGSADQAGAGLSAAAGAAGIPRPVQAEVHLYRQAAAHGQSGHRAGAHALFAGRGHHRPAGLVGSQPAEHPGAHRGGPPRARGLHRRERHAAVGRLFADRAAHHGARVRRREPAARLRGGRGHPPRHGIRGVRRVAGSGQLRAAPRGKAINFGLIYGMGVFGLASNLGITRDAAQAYIDRYFARYPGVAMYMEETRRLAREQGYVETVFGRRLQLPEIRGASGPRRQGAERAAINAPMQGTAADLIKMAMVAVQDWLQAEGMQTRMIMQVHDELVLEAPDAEIEAVREALPRLMCNVAELRVPLVAEVGVGKNWEQAH